MIGPWQTRFIILCVSALPIIVSFTLFEPEAKGYAELWRDLIKDLGVVIGALTIVDLVWALVGGEPTRKAIISLETNLSKTENTVVAFSKLTQDAKSAGLARVGANSSSLSYSPREIITLIQNSRKNIDLSGWALVLLHENSDIIQALTNAAGRNVKIRIVVAAPDNRWLEGSNDKKVIPGMKGVIEGTLAILKSANDKISEKKAYPSGSGTTKCGDGGMGLVVEHMANIIGGLPYG